MGCADRPVTIELPMPVVVVMVLALAMSLGVVVPASAASDATLFRIFLRDGTSVVSYGEFARVDGQVIFSMPAGGPSAEPRLQVVTVPDATVDWYRTDQYVAAARAQHYADTRGEDDFQQLSNEIGIAHV